MSIILISGANKGIGRGLVAKYLARPQVTVIAAVRNPDLDDVKSLLSIPTANGSRVVIIKIDATSNTDALEAIKFLESQGITSLDVVIANAGLFERVDFVPLAELEISHFQEHLNVNTVGPLRLFQATLPLLKKSTNPRFLLMTSIMGSMGAEVGTRFYLGGYGATKAAANFLIHKIHFENDDIATLALEPGPVSTPAGNDAARKVGYLGDMVEVEHTVNAMVSKIDSLSKSEGSGEFWSHDGTIIPW